MKKKTISLSLIILLFFSCSREYIKPLKVKRNFTGSLWIVRHQISTPENIDKIIGIVEKSDIKNIFVQVRGRGDSYYSSEFEPAGRDVIAGFDPLQYLIAKTENTDLKIHAWINISLVLNPDQYPPPENHVLSKHPEWITYDHTGRPMTDYSAKELRQNLLEGYFIDPAIPEVKLYLNNLVGDILSKYRLSGIHLDFIRYPYSGYNSYYGRILKDFGYNPVARGIFKNRYGIDPADIKNGAPSVEKDLFNKFRMEQVTEIVHMINTTVKEKDKNLVISAAVMPRYDRGKNVYFQDWPEWLNKGYIDLACVMSYASKKTVFDEYIDYALRTGNSDKIYMGIQVKKNTPLKYAHAQIKASYENNMRGYILFSFEHNAQFIDKINSLINYKNESYKY